LASPAQEEIVIPILADPVDMADDATDGRPLSQRSEAHEPDTARRTKRHALLPLFCKIRRLPNLI
jgi:hypothetical protein